MDAVHPMQTTLLILYFIGTPPTDPAGVTKRDQETAISWTLQSTSQIETPSPNACYTLGNQIIAKIDKVNTMTVRAYCLCAEGNGTICDGAEGAQTKGGAPKETMKLEKSIPTVQAIGREPLQKPRLIPKDR